jgi:hypothetical protein
MSDTIVPATPVVVAGKSPITTVHGIIAMAAFVLSAVACKYFGLNDGVTAAISSGVGFLLVAMGFQQTTDTATSQAMAAMLSDQINAGIAAALALHNKNATDIAVTKAQLAVVVPQPITSVPTVISPSPPLVTTPGGVTTPESGAHLVND